MHPLLSSVWQRPWARRCLWALAALLLLWALAWLSVPAAVRALVHKYASEALGREVTVEKVDFFPWSLTLDVHGLAVAAAQGGPGAPSQLRVGRIHVNAALQSLWRLAPVIDALEIDDPVLRVARLQGGGLDVDDVLERLAESPEPKDPNAPPARFALYNVQLRGGAVAFDDRVVGEQHRLDKLELRLPFLSSLPAAREVHVTPHLAFELNGSPFGTKAESTPFSDARQTQAQLQVKDLDLAAFAAYLPATVPARLAAGRLDADLRLHFEQDAQPLFKLGGQVALRDVQITDAQKAPLLAFDALQVELEDMRPLERVVNIAAIDWRAPQLTLRRDASGALALAAMAGGQNREEAPSAGQAQESSAPPQAPAWRLQLGQLRLRQGVLDWSDASLPGAGAKAAWKADELALEASSIAWPLIEPLAFRASARLSGGEARTAAQWALEGRASEDAAQVALSLRGLDLELAAPYLAQALAPRLAGTLDMDVGLARQGGQLVVNVGRLALERASLSCAGQTACPQLREAGIPAAAAGAQMALGRLELQHAMVFPAERRVALERVHLAAPQLLLARDKDGRWMFDDWLRSAPDTKAQGKAQQGEAPPWALRVGTLETEGGALALRDGAQDGAVALNFSALSAKLEQLSWSDGRLAPLAWRIQARVGAGRAEPGQLALQGRAALDPRLQVQAQVRARNLPLHALEPYVAQELNVQVLRADGSFTGDLRYTALAAGPELALQGDAALDELRVRVAEGGGDVSEALERVGGRGNELLRWKSLALRGVGLQVAPGKPLVLDVRETALSDFFARIIVQESGRINLQDIRKQGGPTQLAQEAAPAPSGPDPLAPVIRFGPVALVNGEVDFSDHFIKPNYSANLTQLVGSLSAFSSQAPAAGQAPEMAALSLRGRAQGTATLEVTGSVNPLAKPLALDIQGKMQDLELPPLSPYSVKYAGHGIERGKLNMDVAYKVQADGQLTASNRLVLKQLAFGDAVAGAPASLPVRLAVALLADRNGVIDVELPISGSLNDPQFRIGAVVFKVVVNLIMKAVTAPFSLLAGIFGSADEQGVVPFAFGSAQLDAPARAQLDKIAKALADRPALKLTVVGWAQPEAELDAWKRQRLQDLLLSHKRRTLLRAGQDAAKVTAVTPEEYPQLLKEVYRRADNIAKRRNLVGFSKDVPDSEMEALLLASITVPAQAMQELALARGVAVRDYLAGREIAQERLFVGASKLQETGKSGPSWAPKAELLLSTQ